MEKLHLRGAPGLVAELVNGAMIWAEISGLRASVLPVSAGCPGYTNLLFGFYIL